MAPFWEPKLLRNRPQKLSEIFCSKMAQNRPKTGPRLPQGGPRSHLEPILENLGSQDGPKEAILGHLGSILGRLGPPLGHLGPARATNPKNEEGERSFFSTPPTRYARKGAETTTIRIRVLTSGGIFPLLGGDCHVTSPPRYALRR